MDATIEEQKQVGVAPNSEAEERAVALHGRLEKAEADRDRVGLEFGQAVIDLREEIKASGVRDFVARLRQLGIQAKARYWIDKVEGRNPNRHKAGSAGDSPRAPERYAFNWDAAVARVEDLKDDVYRLKSEEPQGSDALFGPLSDLAGVLGFELSRGGDNA